MARSKLDEKIALVAKRGMRLFATGALAALAFASCRQLTGLDELSHEDPATGVLHASACAAFDYADESCRDCSDRACCVEQAECAADATCDAFVRCLARCADGDPHCQSACAARVPHAYGDSWGKLVHCRARECTSDCRVRCGGYVEMSGACDDCMAKHCCELDEVWSLNPEAPRYDYCAQNCANLPGCEAECASRFPGGIEDTSAAAQCFRDKCLSVCRDSVWSCVEDGVVWPEQPATATASASLGIVSFENVSVADLSVTACDPFADQCDPPIAVGIYDDGVTRVELPVAAASHGFSGFLRITGPTVPTTRVYFAPPVLGDRYYVIPLPSLELTGEVTANLCGEVIPDTGYVVILPRDCGMAGADAVTAELSPQPADACTFYFRAGQVSTTATQTAGDSAVVGIVNVAPGFYDVRGLVGGECFGAMPITVRANELTIALLAPTPGGC